MRSKYYCRYRRNGLLEAPPPATATIGTTSTIKRKEDRKWKRTKTEDERKQ